MERIQSLNSQITKNKTSGKSTMTLIDNRNGKPN